MATESEIVARLGSMRIPLLRANAYGCVAGRRTTDDVATELNQMVNQLGNAPMFDVAMEFRERIELDSTGESRPSPEHFASDADFDAAADAVLEKYDRSLPWCRTENSLEAEIRALLNWSLNDKCYVYENESGQEESVHPRFDREQLRWTARDPNQFEVFEQLEQRHQAAIDAIVNDTLQLVSSDSPGIYEAEHLLLDGDAYGWICFFDQALAIMTSKHAVMLWAGFDGWYG